MTTQEFSNGFDTLLNSFGDAQLNIVLDEYEKSVFLTKAQNEYVIGLYTGKNSFGDSFEKTEEIRRYLAPLIKEAEVNPMVAQEAHDDEPAVVLPHGMETSPKFFKLPPDLWFITYERALSAGETCDYKANQAVYPVRQDEYNRIRKNPFRGANDRRALRLDHSDNIVEIISKYGVTTYYVRYLRRLNPIILSDLDGNDIGGKTTATPCELPDSLHQKILELAVKLALQSKGLIKENNENR